MKQLDKQFLTLQFRIQIYEKNGSEYQRFFENIMEKAYPDFIKIKPYGRNGDAGNDGYCKKRGVYYQVYAPDQPVIKEAKAAQKLKRDFQKLLKSNWSEISNIKEYYFVYNNKYTGSIEAIERAISQLENENPGIQFDTFLARNLENTFFMLDISSILDLGFNINLTEAVANAYIYLAKVEIEIDKENDLFAVNLLENIHDIIDTLKNDQLELEYKILEGQCLQKSEKNDEAKSHYENLVVQFPNDPRPILYLSEIYLKDNDLEWNKELLDMAERIDSDNWLLKFEKLVRACQIDEDIDLININEENFPDEYRIKADLYRLYSIALNKSGDTTKADTYIQKAIKLNPNKLLSYINEISFKQMRIFQDQDRIDMQKLNQLLSDIEMIEERFVKFRSRIQVMLNVRKSDIYNALKKYNKHILFMHKTLQEIYNCYFDEMIDEILIYILTRVKIPDAELDKVAYFLTESKKQISETLAKSLICQFAYREEFIDASEAFFTKISFKKYIDFINHIKNKEYDRIVTYVKDDIPFAFGLAESLKNLPDLRKQIIESLPDEKDIQKKKLLLILNYDKKDFDKAFEILKKIDLSQLGYLECKPIFEIVRKKQAWDLLVIIIEKLLIYEVNDEIIDFLKRDLFHANFHLGKYPKVIEIGNEILTKKSHYDKLNAKDKEMLLARIVISHYMRGEYNLAKQFLSQYPLSDPSFEFKIAIEAEIYLASNEADLALQAVVEGVKIKKVLSREEYTKLYPLLAIKIGNSLGLKLESLNEIKEGLFVKFKDEESWYYIGDNNALDAIKIGKDSVSFPLFINKKVGETVIFESEYGTTKHIKEIEKILSLEFYILWKSADNFHRLAQDNLLDGVQMIEVPEKEGIFDFQYLKAFLEGIHQKTKPAFEMYHQNCLPLAMLTVSEGSIHNALGRIRLEGKGYVNCTMGTAEDLKKQTSFAKTIIDDHIEFYIDGTSLFFLLEFGLLKKVYTNLPTMKIPQSAINFLYRIADESRYKPGQAGYMQYKMGEISILPVDKEKRDFNQSIINESIRYFESNSGCIGDISLTSKFDGYSERIIPAEFCDACILAQKENIPILTEDYLYLKWNEVETKKKTPGHFSSIILLRLLYERKLISFEEYLDYFEYLSFYRFRFLAFSTDDIIKAVFGDKQILRVRPENIRKLNFPLTLSKEYGVPFQTAFVVVFKFLIYAITSNAILPETAEKIFVEIIESFPTEMDKKDLGYILLETSELLIQQDKSKYIIIPKSKLTQKKIENLHKINKIYDFETRLWKPKNNVDNEEKG